MINPMDHVQIDVETGDGPRHYTAKLKAGEPADRGVEGYGDTAVDALRDLSYKLWDCANAWYRMWTACQPKTDPPAAPETQPEGLGAE